MTGFRRGPEDDEALVVAARRRALADSERRELDAALAADPTLRVAHDVGRAFDDAAFVRPGDEALIARAVDRTLGSPNRRGASRPWSVAVAVAAAFLLIASVAAAYRAGVAIGPRLRRAPAPSPSPSVNDHDSARRILHTRATARAAEIPADPGASITASAALDPGSDPIAAPAPRAAIDKPSSATASAGANVGPVPDAPTTPPPLPTASAASNGVSAGNVTAADLFQRAGAARRAGSLDAACARYGDLQTLFPAAEETRVSQVSLGKLLLEMGRPQEAERHFAIYLAGGTGALAAEATFGRAQSLERMGRVRDERDAWLGLLRDFPGSVYAGAARRRLAALGPESP